MKLYHSQNLNPRVAPDLAHPITASSSRRIWELRFAKITAVTKKPRRDISAG
ncbi:MAG: hypothetical protein KGZ77_15525 [Rhodobacteraceae bacterium]|nr:hypothetical protein [Paracoccaceae bacterium]